MSKEVAKKDQALVKAAPTLSERFLADVEKQFVAQMGRGMEFTALEQRLVQHMYISVDQALKAAEEKRTKGWPAEKLATASEDERAFTWHHVDRQKLALDTVHRVSLGLDALIPNHIWPIAYFNGTKNLYDIDLRIGYVGRDYVTRRFALERPLDITYELVYATDQFRALPRSASRDVEGYEFEITSPFDRGDIVGGFGYIVYDDPRKNRLVLVTQRDFKRARAASKSDFWAKNDVEMHLKTVYHRTAAKIVLDPAKVNASVLASVLEDDRDPVEQAHLEVHAAAQRAGNRQLVDVQRPAPAAVEAVEGPETVTVEANGSLFDEGESPAPVDAPF